MSEAYKRLAASLNQAETETPFDRIRNAQPLPERTPFQSTLKSTTAGMANAFAGQPLEDIGQAIGSKGLQGFGQNVRQQAEAVQQANPSAINSLSDAAAHPWDTVKTAVGNVLPQIPVSLASAATGARLGGMVGGLPGAAIGGLAGAFAPNYLQEYAEMRGKQREAGQENIPKALGYALPAAGLETAADVFGLGRVMPDAVKNSVIGKALGSDTLTGNRLAHVGKQAAKGIGAEAGTEYAQTGLEQIGGNQALDTEQAANERNVSALLGGIGGGVIRGGLSAFDQRNPLAGQWQAPGYEYKGEGIAGPQQRGDVIAGPNMPWETPEAIDVSQVSRRGPGDVEPEQPLNISPQDARNWNYPGLQPYQYDGDVMQPGVSGLLGSPDAIDAEYTVTPTGQPVPDSVKESAAQGGALSTALLAGSQQVKTHARGLLGFNQPSDIQEAPEQPQESSFTPTHLLSDGTPVIPTDEPNIWFDGANEIEDDYAEPINATNTPRINAAIDTRAAGDNPATSGEDRGTGNPVIAGDTGTTARGIGGIGAGLQGQTPGDSQPGRALTGFTPEETAEIINAGAKDLTSYARGRFGAERVKGRNLNQEIEKLNVQSQNPTPQETATEEAVNANINNELSPNKQAKQSASDVLYPNVAANQEARNKPLVSDEQSAMPIPGTQDQEQGISPAISGKDEGKAADETLNPTDQRSVITKEEEKELDSMLRDLSKAQKALDKTHPKLGNYQHETRARATTRSANAGNAARMRDDYKKLLKNKLRSMLLEGKQIPQKYIDSVGSSIEYDENGKYAPIQAAKTKNTDAQPSIQPARPETPTVPQASLSTDADTTAMVDSANEANQAVQDDKGVSPKQDITQPKSKREKAEQKPWLMTQDDYVKANPDIRESRARNRWAGGVFDAFNAGEDVPESVLTELREKSPGFIPDAISDDDTLLDRLSNKIDNHIENSIIRKSDELARLTKAYDRKIRKQKLGYMEARTVLKEETEELDKLRKELNALKDEAEERKRGNKKGKFALKTARQYQNREIDKVNAARKSGQPIPKVSEDIPEEQVAIEPERIGDIVPKTPAIHIEGKTQTKATPAEINDALKKASERKSWSKTQMRDWLVGEIDKAIESAHDFDTDKANYNKAEYLARKELGRFANNKTKLAQKTKELIDSVDTTGYLNDFGQITFDVPGDGRFKVLNTKQHLEAFKQKVLASSGFKETRDTKGTRQPSSKQADALRIAQQYVNEAKNASSNEERDEALSMVLDISRNEQYDKKTLNDLFSNADTVSRGRFKELYEGEESQPEPQESLETIFKSLGKDKQIKASDINHPQAELIADVQNNWHRVLIDHGYIENKDGTFSDVGGKETKPKRILIKGKGCS